jgi:hypothetical protein
MARVTGLSKRSSPPLAAPMTSSQRIYKERPRRDRRGVNLISDALPYSPLWFAGPNGISNAISFAKFNSRSHDAVIRVYDEVGNVIEIHEQADEFREP